MDELIIGKTYSMVDSRDDREYIYKIQNVINKYNIKATGKYGLSYIIDLSLYKNIKEIQTESKNINHYGGQENPHEPIKIIEYYKLGFNIGNVVKYILRAGIKYPSIEGKIEDLKKAIWYLGREIENLEKEKNNG